MMDEFFSPPDSFNEWSPAAGDAVINLGDNAGVNKASIKDSDGNEVAYINSNGDIVVQGDATVTVNQTIQGNLTMTDDNWIGLGAAAGRMVFDDQATDYISFMDCKVGIGTTSPGAELQINTPIGDNKETLTVDMGNTGYVGQYGLLIENIDEDHMHYPIMVKSSDENEQFFIKSTGTNDLFETYIKGNVGIGTTAPGQLLDVNSGGGNMIADGYDTHSLAVYKENIEDASGYLDKVLACPAQKWNRKPFVSADEIKEAVLEEFGEDVLIEEAVEAKEAVLDEDGNESEPAVEAKDAVYERQYSVWDELFPEDNSHRQKALYNMPDGDLKTWIDDWCEAKRVEMRPEDKWQKKRLGLVADAELTAEHLPEVISINDDGEPTGIDTMTYIGILHNAIQELSAKVEALENK